MNKEIKYMVNTLIKMTDEDVAGMLIATLLDALNKFVDGVEERNMRKIEIIINDYFRDSYDFTKTPDKLN